jgi:hypothetical protein
MVEAKPASSEDFFAWSVTFAAGCDRCLHGRVDRSVGWGGILAVGNPPGSFSQISFLEADAPDGNRLVASLGDLLLLPDVGDVEVRKDGIRVRRAARIKGVTFACMGWLAAVV